MRHRREVFWLAILAAYASTEEAAALFIRLQLDGLGSVAITVLSGHMAWLSAT